MGLIVSSWLIAIYWSVYQNFQVTRIHPTIGPRAGGTEITFIGQDLDTGSSLQVMFDYIPCPIDRLVQHYTSIINQRTTAALCS